MKKYILIIACFFILIFAASCSKKSEPEKLTLEIAQELSSKGDNLSRKDFENYESKEIGSGLYILMYAIDDKYAVLIGGVPDEKPMYIYLTFNYIASKDTDTKRIDIRYDDVEEFINSTK